MRKVFVSCLLRLAERDQNLWLLTGDLGFNVLEPFVERYPARFVNVGVAEQNLVGVAAGLAMTGKEVYVYSIANFPVFRALEQLRNDVCGHRLRVRIVGVGGGYQYAASGYTHHMLEDVAVMRVLPGMTVLVPADLAETSALVSQLPDVQGPAYLRLGRARGELGRPREAAITLGRPRELRAGRDIALMAAGPCAGMALEVADLLESQGLSAQVLSMHTLVPIDRDAVIRIATDAKLVAVLEEHAAAGGLYSAVAEVLAGLPARCLGFGLQAGASPLAGSEAYLWQRARFTAESVRDSLLQALAGYADV